MQLVSFMLANYIYGFDHFFKFWVNVFISFHLFIHLFVQIAFIESSQFLVGLGCKNQQATVLPLGCS